MLTFTTKIFNPIARRSAGKPGSPFALIQHVGRKSGTTYSTPLIVRLLPNGLLLTLTYGPEVDWYRNVVAADRCTIIWNGQTYALHGIEPVAVAIALRSFPLPLRLVLQLRGTRDFVKMTFDDV